MKDEALIKLADTGGRIRKVREASGLNLHELALLSGVSAPALSLIETGKRDLRLTSLFRIAAALRIGAGELIDERPGGVPTGDPGDPGDPGDLGGEGYDLEDYA